jgi:beta-N-acetylhexosaminidase
MDISSLLGQLFIVGLPRPTLDEETRKFLTTFCPGGVILFQHNAPDPQTLLALCQDLHVLPTPPLISIDHEGGRVQRLASPFTHFPTAACLGATSSPFLAGRVGEAMAEELRAVGIDLNFAPILDVLTNPGNPVIGDRAFSSRPDIVAQMGGALMLGLQKGGVIPCGKHFPGHGHTSADSHITLPCVDKTFDELMQAEIPPFRRVISAQVATIMTAHVLYPALDPDLPATLSPAILTGLLRQKLGYRRVVITDDLEMGAIASHLSVGEATVKALYAGADMVLICHSWERVWEAHAACEQALADGTLAQSRLQEAYHRVTTLKKNHFRPVPLPPLSSIGSPEHQRLREKIEQRASQSA